MFIKQSLYFLCFALVLVSCSTKRNTFVSRQYHNVTARYNGYYYSGLNIDDGIYKIEKNNKDNFDKILPVYIYPTSESAKTTFPEFDKAIKKSSLCIQRHAIKDKKLNEIPSAGKWIDNNWINIGIASFYKREFFTGLENFEYVARTYTKSKDKYTAMLWMTKTNNEVGAVSASEQIISLLKNEKKLPKAIKKELSVVEADYYIRRGLYTEASAKLIESLRNNKPIIGIKRDKRARYAFIIAQLFEQQKDNKQAITYYKKCIQLKPDYDLVFYSKIKMARMLDVKNNNSEKTKKGLLKMGNELKNSDYYDVIFYTLGEIEEKEGNQTQAIYYYKKAVKTSTTNAKQKALAYLKIGEINFDLTNYQTAGNYYDSAIVTLPKDHQDYVNIVARKKTLNDLVSQITIIKNEDSLQRIAKMSDAERNNFIDKLIIQAEKDEERKLKEKDAAQTNGNDVNALNTNTNIVTQNLSSGAVSFYFYNPTTVAFGVADFQKKWGNRNYEDNWRRSNKAASIDNSLKKDSLKTASVKGNQTILSKKSRDYYKKDLPTSDSLIALSNKKIIDAYYLMGSIYKEELNNTKKTIASFEELNTRFPKNKYALNTYYFLYRIYQAEKRDDKANYYKDKLLNEFPDSEFALLLKNPNYAQERNSKLSEAESFYNIVYSSFHNEANYNQALNQANEALFKFGNNAFTPKFEFIKSLSVGKLKGVDSLEFYLKLLVVKYPKAEVTPLAYDILQAIKKQKNPDLFKPVDPNKTLQLDTFVVNFEAEHFLIAIVPDEPKIANGFKLNLDAFSNKYYSAKKFSLTSVIFGTNKQLVLLKSFANANEVINYYTNLMQDAEVFQGDVKKELMEIYPILATNLPILYKKKNTEGYKLFYNDNYKNFNTKQ
jgi:tetratricopeptide (TPR) repeat protein